MIKSSSFAASLRGINRPPTVIQKLIQKQIFNQSNTRANIQIAIWIDNFVPIRSSKVS